MSADEHLEVTDAPASSESSQPDTPTPLQPGTDILPAESYRFIEVGCFQPREDGAEPQPVAIRFDGQDALGRGLIIPADQLAEFASHYRRGAQRSHFRYSQSTYAGVQAARQSGSLLVLADYYFVLNAKSSSEMVHSINQAIDVVELLKEQYDVPYEAAAVYYDGRTIEVHVDAGVFGIQPSPELPQIFRRMTCALIGVDTGAKVPPANYSQLTLDAYSDDYMAGVPGTVTATEPRETYSVRLSYTAFKRLSYQRLNEFVLRQPELPPREVHSTVVPRARELYRTIAEAQQRETKEGDSDAIATIFYRVEEDGTQIATARQLAPALLKRLFNENRQLIGTFSPHLDRSLAGGFSPGDLFVIAGFPGSGTSSMALQLMNHAAEHHSAHCVFVGLQRGVEELFKRSLSHVGRIPISEIDAKRQNPRELYDDREFNKRIFAAYERYQTFSDRIVIIEGAAAADLPRLTEFVRERKEELNARGGEGNNVLLVIDSLQLMVAVMRAVYNRRDNQKSDIFGSVDEADVRILAGRLKALARELDITVLATLEHYQRRTGLIEDSSTEGLPQLFHDTQFADTVMLLSRHGASLQPLADSLRARMAGSAPGGTVETSVARLSELEKQYQAQDDFRRLYSEFALLDILKNRSGAVDKVAFCFHKKYSHFEPLEYTEDG